MKEAKDYYSDHMVNYEPPDAYATRVIEMFPFLKGREWNNVVLGIIDSLNPTSIRVTNSGIKLDARIGRVTVYVDDNDIIKRIEQECDIRVYGVTSIDDENWDKFMGEVDEYLGSHQG